MEKNKGLLVLGVTLSLLVIGLSSYLVYDKLINKDGNDNSVVDNSNESENNSLTIENDIDKLYSEYLLSLKNNLKGIYTEHDAEIRIHSNFANGNPYSITSDKEGKLIMSTNEKDYEISNNVLQMFLTSVGNGGYKSLYFIKEDGTLNSICVDCVLEDGIKVKQLKHKNIVNVVNAAFGITYSGAYGPIFIDIEGNAFFGE